MVLRVHFVAETNDFSSRFKEPNMSTILYKNGDATQPTTGGCNIIAHICNDIGGWGRGFVLALSRRWPEPEQAYRRWHAEQSPAFELGALQLVEISATLHVANMIAQRGIQATADGPPIRYAALRTCLRTLTAHAQRLDANVHMPRIGCGLAGGTWDEVGPIIEDTLVAGNVAVHVYDFTTPRPAGKA